MSRGAEIEKQIVENFITKVKFLSFDEISYWNESEDWEMIRENYSKFKVMIDIRFTPEFYTILKIMYDNIFNENIIKKMGKLLFEDGIELKKSGNMIYEYPIKRMQDAYYLLQYCVHILLMKNSNLVNDIAIKYNRDVESVSRIILVYMKVILDTNWDGIGTWRA
jgi:hypothetical protein